MSGGSYVTFIDPDTKDFTIVIETMVCGHVCVCVCACVRTCVYSYVEADAHQSTFIPQSHDHSVCIRPSLPAYNVTEQSATFKLGGSLVSDKELSPSDHYCTVCRRLKPCLLASGSPHSCSRKVRHQVILKKCHQLR